MKGKVVKQVRYLGDAELSREGWVRKTVAVEFTDGTILFASCDDEGNDSGALFARKPDGSPISLTPGGAGKDSRRTASVYPEGV